MTAPWLAAQTQIRQVVQQAKNQLVDITAQPFLHLRHMQCGDQRGFLAVMDFRLQQCRRHRVADAQVVLQILFIALADIQLPAQAGERRDGHFFRNLRQGLESPIGRGRRDVSRGGFEGVSFGFGTFEVVQRRVQQRHRPDACSPGFQP